MPRHVLSPLKKIHKKRVTIECAKKYIYKNEPFYTVLKVLYFIFLGITNDLIRTL